MNCRWFHLWGLATESEIQQRRQVQSISDPTTLVREMVLFELKPWTEIKKAEFGCH